MTVRIGRAMDYDIVISASDNLGFIVKIGCATAVAEDEAHLFEVLKTYLSDPKAAGMMYAKNSRATEERPLPSRPLTHRGNLGEGQGQDEEAAR